MSLYPATNNLNNLNANLPNSAAEPVSNLGLAAVETRTVMKNVITNEHNTDGTHKTVNGAVLVAGSVPASALAAGAIGTDLIGVGAVTGTQIAAQTITEGNMAALSVGTAELINTSVTPIKLAGDSTAGDILVSNGTGGMALVTMSGDATISGTGVVTLTGSIPTQQVTEFSNQQPQNTAGGALTAGTWSPVALNSTLFDSSSSKTSLSANKITLAVAGTYMIDAWAAGYECGLHQIKLVDQTVSGSPVDVGWGSSEASPTGTAVTSASKLSTVITTTVANTIWQLQHNCATTNSTNGQGVPANLAEEVYAWVRVIRLA